MGKIRDTITFIVAIILFSAPLSVIFVLGESNVKWWWLLGYYLIVIISSFALIGMKHSVLQDMGRDMVKVPLIFVLGCTSPIIIIIYITLFAIRAITGHDILGFIWPGFFIFVFVMGYWRFKEREESFVLLKKPKRKEEKFVGKKKSKEEIKSQKWTEKSVVRIEGLSAEEWVNKACSLDKLNRFKEAIACCDKALEINPELDGAWNNRGASLHNLGMFEEAIASYNKALGINPNFAEAWTGKGLSLQKLERFGEAIICFDKALEIIPKYAEAWNAKGASLGELGKFRDALICFNEALKINPWNALARLNRKACKRRMK